VFPAMAFTWTFFSVPQHPRNHAANLHNGRAERMNLDPAGLRAGRNLHPHSRLLVGSAGIISLAVMDLHRPVAANLGRTRKMPPARPARGICPVQARPIRKFPLSSVVAVPCDKLFARAFTATPSMASPSGVSTRPGDGACGTSFTFCSVRSSPAETFTLTLACGVALLTKPTLSAPKL